MLDEALVTAGDLMTRDVAVAHPETTLLEAVTLMAKPSIDALNRNEMIVWAITTLRIEAWVVDTSAVWQAAAIVKEK